VGEAARMTQRNLRLLVTTLLTCATTLAVAEGSCPTTITSAATKVFAGAKVTKCKQGSDHFVVHLQKADGMKAEIELTAKGDITETEEGVALTAVPATVTKAFAARYPKLTASRAEKQTKASDKSVTFELAAEVAKDDRTEATFANDGTFLEEEAIVPASTLPAAVTKAFAAKYPKAKAERVEKQTKSDKTVTFEIAFAGDKGRIEATFKDDGSFVEEE
jgi:hypothetical protein